MTCDSLGYFKKGKKFGGFTLIELLVGLTIILAIGTMVFSIFVATLRSTNKSVSTNAIQQNGSYALSQMTRSIRNAKDFNGVSLSGGEPFTTSCVMAEGPTPPYTQYKAVKITNFDNQTEIYRCPIDDETEIFYNDQPLTNSDLVSTTPSSCFLTCIQATASSVPVIGIDFTMRNANQTGATDIDSSKHFQTTVSPRNFGR